MTENTAALPAAERPGTPALPQDLIDVDALLEAYHTGHPDVTDPAQKVVFGTSGHRGSAFTTSFNDDHIAAITQAIVEYRAQEGTTGPLFMGQDTHALSAVAQDTALQVLAANGVTVLLDSRDGYTPTSALSPAILTYNKDRERDLAVRPRHRRRADRQGGDAAVAPEGRARPARPRASAWTRP